MQKFMNKLEKVKNTAAGLAICAVPAYTCAMNTYCAGASAMISKALGYVATIFIYVGIFFAVVSFVQLMLALKRDDAEGQSTQIRNLIIGLVLTGSAGIMNAIAGATGEGITVEKQNI